MALKKTWLWHALACSGMLWHALACSGMLWQWKTRFFEGHGGSQKSWAFSWKPHARTWLCLIWEMLFFQVAWLKMRVGSEELTQTPPGWWFGTWILWHFMTFPSKNGFMSSSQLSPSVHHFSPRGRRKTTNHHCSHSSCSLLRSSPHRSRHVGYLHWSIGATSERDPNPFSRRNKLESAR